MTIVCAVKCNDGVAIGSDGKASMATTSGYIKHDIQKIHKMGDRTVFIASGTIGLIQKSMDILRGYSKELDKGLNTQTLESIKREIFPILRSAKETYIAYNGKEEGTPKVNIALCGLDVSNELRIWHMSGDTHDEFIDAVGHYCSGSGEVPMHTMLNAFLPVTRTIKVATTVMYRGIKETINTLIGIEDPISIWTMKNNGEIKIFSPKDLKLLESICRRWKLMDQKFANSN
jgi:20S proteasome alpha/beta subunit